MPERLGLFQRMLLISEAGKGINWHESFSAELQIQARSFQAPTMFTTPCRGILENLKFWLNSQNFEGNGWKRKMSILRLPLEMIEFCHNHWQVWFFPSKFGVLMCCPASPAGQMELRKTRVTSLCLWKVFCRSSLSFPQPVVFMYVILICRVIGMGRLPSSISLVWGNLQICTFYVEVIFKTCGYVY